MILAGTILALAIVFLGLTVAIVLGKAWRERREAYDRARRQLFEPRILAYAQAPEGSIRAALGRELRTRDARVVEAVLLDHAQRVRGSAFERLAHALDELGYVGRYVEALQSSRSWRRAWAAEQLGIAGARRAVPDLVRALHDPMTDVRMRAAKSLGLLGGTASIRELVPALDEPSRWSSIRVADVLATMGRGVVGEVIALYPVLGPTGRLAALDVVARARPLEAVPWLIERLADSSADARSRAAHALGAIADPRAVPCLLQALEDTEWPVRAMAVKALGRIGEARTIPVLKRAMGDRAWWVRSNAAHALGAFGDAGDGALEEALDSTDRFVRAQAVIVLEERGVVDRRADGLLSADPETRHASATFLHRLAAAGGTERLTALASLAPDLALRERLRALLPTPAEGGP